MPLDEENFGPHNIRPTNICATWHLSYCNANASHAMFAHYVITVMPLQWGHQYHISILSTTNAILALYVMVAMNEMVAPMP
jgi:hypothetical protein